MRWLALPLVLASVITGHATAGTRGVISVVATRGPITPVCAVEVPCYGPAARVRIVVRHGGVVVGRAVTDRRGRARFMLAPGRYIVLASFRGGLKAAVESKAILVGTGRTSLVRFSFDTGIR